MELSNHSSPVLTETAALKKTMMGMLPCGNVHRKKPGKLDDVRSNGWVDAMIASSPPRRKLTKDVCFEFSSDEAYLTWMINCPSALNSFEHIANFGKTKEIAIFLDYDGTLSPIVDDPDQAIISEEMRAVVRSISKCFPTAIISGRRRDKVFELVGVAGLHYAGSHGMDIMAPSCCVDEEGKKVNLFQPAKEFIPVIDEVFRTLVDKTKEIKGAKVENHKFCASVHYRNVDEKNWPTVAQIVHDILMNYPRLRLTHGRKVLEIRPVIDWNKGKALEFILESLAADAGLASGNDFFPIYIGDDRTDEDAFMVLKKASRGCGILVSSVPKETNASYSLRDPAEVMSFLKCLVKWRMMEEGV